MEKKIQIDFEIQKQRQTKILAEDQIIKNMVKTGFLSMDKRYDLKYILEKFYSSGFGSKGRFKKAIDRYKNA